VDQIGWVERLRAEPAAEAGKEHANTHQTRGNKDCKKAALHGYGEDLADIGYLAHNVGWRAEFQGAQRLEKRQAMTPTAAAAGPVNGGQA